MIVSEIAAESLRQLEELRQAHHEATRLLQTGGNTAVTRMLAFVAYELGEIWHRDSPRLTGTLASAEREQVFNDQARIFLDPTVVNPVFGGRPEIYGPIVHQRKPWVANLMQRDAPRILAEGGSQLFQELDGVYRV